MVMLMDPAYCPFKLFGESVSFPCGLFASQKYNRTQTAHLATVIIGHVNSSENEKNFGLRAKLLGAVLARRLCSAGPYMKGNASFPISNVIRIEVNV